MPYVGNITVFFFFVFFLFFFPRQHECQRTDPRWQRGMFSFRYMYNFLTVRANSAMKFVHKVEIDDRSYFGNLIEIECLGQTLSEESTYF